MDAKFIIVVAAVGLAAFVLGLLVAARRRSRRDGQMLVQPSPLAAGAAPPAAASSARRIAPGSVNLQLGRDLEQLLSAGKKIEAIKIVRERTGMSLKDSKEAVERLEDLMRSTSGGRD